LITFLCGKIFIPVNHQFAGFFRKFNRGHLKYIRLARYPVHLKQYFPEKNAFTVVTGVFCLVMTIVSALQYKIWQAAGFALAFSFAVELICHGAMERR
jgi:hypothetical protein